MTLALVGCGKMGGALLRGWLARGGDEVFDVLEPGDLPGFAMDPRVNHFKTTADFVEKVRPEALFLAVKPQVMDPACEALRAAVGPQTLIVSIAAGRTIESFRRIFGADQPVIRAMPNTPAAIGKGMTVAVASTGVSEVQKARAGAWLGVTGRLEWVADEALMDAVTAVSGSGPAYVFALIETLAQAGESAGLDPSLSMILARQTIIGAAALAESDPGTPAESLRQNVTSPGGTTQAALEVLLEKTALPDLMIRTVAAAVARGQALGQKA